MDAYLKIQAVKKKSSVPMRFFVLAVISVLKWVAIMMNQRVSYFDKQTGTVIAQP